VTAQLQLIIIIIIIKYFPVDDTYIIATIKTVLHLVLQKLQPWAQIIELAKLHACVVVTVMKGKNYCFLNMALSNCYCMDMRIVRCTSTSDVFNYRN
jgi:peroxiredoxin family protein